MISFYQWVNSSRTIDHQIDEEVKKKEEELKKNDDICLFGDRIITVKPQRNIRPAVYSQNEDRLHYSLEGKRSRSKEYQEEPSIFRNLAIKKKLRKSQIGERIHNHKSFGGMKLTQKRLTLNDTSKTKLKVMGSRSSLRNSFEHIQSDKQKGLVMKGEKKESRRYQTLGDQPQKQDSNIEIKKQNKAIFFFQQSPRVKLMLKQSKSKTVRASSSSGFHVVENKEKQLQQKKCRNFLQVRHLGVASKAQKREGRVKTQANQERANHFHHWQGIKRRKVVKARFNMLAEDDESISGWIA